MLLSIKQLSFTFFVGMVLISCNKGAVLTHDLDVQFINSTNTTIYPTGAFPHFDPNDPFEQDVYPHFVNYVTPSIINADFKEDLTAYLKKNKIHLVQDSTTYRLEITSISYSESNNRSSYVDSCSFGYPYTYVYYSDYTVTAHASLFKGSTLIEQWTESDYASERVKSARDACNKPEIGIPLQSLSGVAKNVAKKIRARVSTKLKALVG